MKQTTDIINVTKLSQFCKITGAFTPLKDLDNKSVHRYQLPTSKSSLDSRRFTVVVMIWLLKFHISTIVTTIITMSPPLCTHLQEKECLILSANLISIQGFCVFFILFNFIFDWCCFVDPICDFFPLYFSISE